MGICNQRETALVWERSTGKAIYNAVVWQCSRGVQLCEEIERNGKAEIVHSRTGLELSPYFSASKIAWILRNVKGAQRRAEKGELCCGTIDSWLIYRLTEGREFRTDYSNASRTQLFNIYNLCWDDELCRVFQIPMCALANITDSNGFYGDTDFDGFLENKIPIHSVMGDSNGALLGQGCFSRGMIKATYGTGSSIMMNVGEKPVFSNKIVTSVAWCLNGKVSYVLEGNINYSGAVISWMKDDLGLISSAKESEQAAERANAFDTTYLVPAFSGLGAPYWKSSAKAAFYGMSRTTKKEELVKAALESIAYQITDIISVMEEEAKIAVKELRVDGGPTRNRYLMQFQSDIAQLPVQVPQAEELSGIGAAYAAGLASGIYQKERLFSGMKKQEYIPSMTEEERKKRYKGWKIAVNKVLM